MNPANQEHNLSQSRILYEQVMVDSQPTEQQIIQRAQELQIDDLQLARQSLTKQLQPHWRPFINRYGDIYYLNLKQHRAYVDHPIDMETKILYAQRHKLTVPKFKRYYFDGVANSIHLIDQQIKKYQKGQFIKTNQSSHNINSQLNIVYEESQESNTEKQHYSEPQQSDDSYIQNLEKQEGEHNIMSRRSSKSGSSDTNKKFSMQAPSKKPSFTQQYKKFPHQRSHTELDQQNELTPQYEQKLLQYQAQLRKQMQKQLQQYQQSKKQNFQKKQQIIRQNIRAKKELKKFTILSQFQSQIQEKNSINFQKQRQKIRNQYDQKTRQYEAALQKYENILQKSQEAQSAKSNFIQSLGERMEKRIIQLKHIKTQQTKNSIYQTFLVNRIKQINLKQEQKFNKELYKHMNKKITDVLGTNSMSNKQNIEKSYSISDMYKKMVRKELLNIDRLIIQNQQDRQNRKRSNSVFQKRKQQVKSHIQFVSEQQQNLSNEQQKQNIIHLSNFYDAMKSDYDSNNEKYHSSMIESQIKKSSQNNKKFIQRRKRIFSQNVGNKYKQGNKNDQNTTILRKQNTKQNKQNKVQQQLKQCYKNNLNNKKYTDKKSLYLRMMTRIL